MDKFEKSGFTPKITHSWIDKEIGGIQFNKIVEPLKKISSNDKLWNDFKMAFIAMHDDSQKEALDDSLADLYDCLRNKDNDDLIPQILRNLFQIVDCNLALDIIQQLTNPKLTYFPEIKPEYKPELPKQEEKVRIIRPEYKPEVPKEETREEVKTKYRPEIQKKEEIKQKYNNIDFCNRTTLQTNITAISQTFRQYNIRALNTQLMNTIATINSPNAQFVFETLDELFATDAHFASGKESILLEKLKNIIDMSLECGQVLNRLFSQL